MWSVTTLDGVHEVEDSLPTNQLWNLADTDGKRIRDIMLQALDAAAKAVDDATRAVARYNHMSDSSHSIIRQYAKHGIR